MSDQADRTKLAARIQALLAQAEGEAAIGNEAARDAFLEKASALQLKYAIDDAMLKATGAQGTDELTHADFCTESNTPLIKAKRQLIAGVAMYNRGHAIMMGEWQDKLRSSGRKWNHRAKVRVFAHQSDLDFITMLYNSLIIQMQRVMARDEEQFRRYRMPPKEGWQAWRVSYAYGWVGRVVDRIMEAKWRNEAKAEVTQPGTSLVLRDRSALVEAHVAEIFPKLRKANYRKDDHSEDGRKAGRVAAEEADIGGKKVGNGAQYRLKA